MKWELLWSNDRHLFKFFIQLRYYDDENIRRGNIDLNFKERADL